jgi:hypothetical protein
MRIRAGLDSSSIQMKESANRSCIYSTLAADAVSAAALQALNAAKGAKDKASAADAAAKRKLTKAPAPMSKLLLLLDVRAALQPKKPLQLPPSALPTSHVAPPSLPLTPSPQVKLTTRLASQATM